MSPPTGEMFVFNIPPGDSFRKDNVQDNWLVRFLPWFVIP